MSRKQQYHTLCTGKALATTENHKLDEDLELFGANFCPFVQRVWVALEHKKIPYKYVECDPYKKPQALLDLNPRGLVPALRIRDGTHGAKPLGESTYLEEALSPPNGDADKHPQLLPPINEPYLRAKARLEADHINRTIVPGFYRYLQAQEEEKQIQYGKEFMDELKGFTERMHAEGPFYNGKELGWVDVMIAPWAFRAANVLKHYRGFTPPEQGRYKAWAEALFKHPAFAATCSTEELYLDSYARYAENRPNTSQVANAINSGSGLP
ncbi:hypothetical protein FRB96_004000 [Tulasnella sp. 330]|nr:hypothetical protein FRB96_004000 [Tulasnella sp. 330]